VCWVLNLIKFKCELDYDAAFNQWVSGARVPEYESEREEEHKCFGIISVWCGVCVLKRAGKWVCVCVVVFLSVLAPPLNVMGNS